MNNEARTEQEFVDEHPYITWCDEVNTANDDGYHELPDGSVTTSKLADGAVTGEKIADGAVTGAKLSDWAITESKIADANVTGEKIADGTITAEKLAFSPGGYTPINRFKGKNIVWVGGDWCENGADYSAHPTLISTALGFGSLIAKVKTGGFTGQYYYYLEGLQEITADASIDNDSIDFIITEGSRSESRSSYNVLNASMGSYIDYAQSNFANAELIFIPSMAYNELHLSVYPHELMIRICTERNMPYVKGTFFALWPNLQPLNDYWVSSYYRVPNKDGQKILAGMLVQGLLTGQCGHTPVSKNARPITKDLTYTASSSMPSTVHSGSNSFMNVDYDGTVHYMLNINTDSTFSENDFVVCFNQVTPPNFEFGMFDLNYTSNKSEYYQFGNVVMRVDFMSTYAYVRISLKGTGESHFNVPISIGNLCCNAFD